MNIGALLIMLALAGVVVSTISFFLAARGHSRFFALGKISYHYFTAAVVLAAGVLFYLFISRNYAYQYVYEYSSSELPLFYLISSFWAGQRGTYLLWLVLQALFGYYLLRRGKQYTSHAMVFYGLVMIFFNVILLVLSPFQKLATPQLDGAGLNPLLKDPWMVIHPPVIFIGYAVAAVPCVIALAALVMKKYDDWLRLAYPPALVGALALAAGNIMGGFWAYKTLGWGGYWAWDPVENSSFIPWMTSLAFIHGFLIERRSNALKRTNLFLALFTFLLVIYGTFLTRSGVLADFSVHSFVDLGVNAYLITFMIGFALLSLVLMIVRAGQITGDKINLSVASQDFALLVSVWLLLLIAMLVLSGTSWPLITTWLGKPGTVDPIVYSRVTFPLAIIIGLFLGFSPFMQRGYEPFGRLLGRVWPSAVGALLVSVLAFSVGVKVFSYQLFIFFVALAFFSNLFVFKRFLPGNIGLAGAQISHFGFALMLLGILGSSAYSINEKVVLDRGETKKVFDLDVTYSGTAGDITTPDNQVLLSVNDGGEVFEARPKLYLSPRGEGMMKKPFIRRHLAYDLYFAPEEIQESSGQGGLELAKGQSTSVGGYTITFIGFDQTPHQAGGVMHFGAVLEVTDSTGKRQTIIPALIYEPGKEMAFKDVPLTPDNPERSVRLEKILADEGKVRLAIAGLAPSTPPDRLVMSVSQKPTMNLLWGGAIILVLGGVVTLGRRWKTPRAERC